MKKGERKKKTKACRGSHLLPLSHGESRSLRSQEHLGVHPEARETHTVNQKLDSVQKCKSLALDRFLKRYQKSFKLTKTQKLSGNSII